MAGNGAKNNKEKLLQFLGSDYYHTILKAWIIADARVGETPNMVIKKYILDSASAG